MPLYEYQCDACENRFERIHQKFSDPPVDTCPRCGKGPVRKLISSPAIQFKGSGWYITDYARKGESSGKSEGKSETTSEPKSKDTSSEKTSSSDSSKDTTSSSSKPAEKPAAASKPEKSGS
jgi:putative FmdB family regulatory protein